MTKKLFGLVVLVLVVALLPLCAHATEVEHVHYGGKATCTERAVCEDCHEPYGEVDPDAHDWGAWVTNNDGTHTRTCQTDTSHTENGNCVGIAAMIEGDKQYHERRCECSYLVVAQEPHTMSDWEEDGEYGWRRVCTVCTDYYEESATNPNTGGGSTIITPTPAPTPKPTPKPHRHSYSGSTTAPTCTSGGYTVYYCSCGDSFVGSRVDALGHAWGAWTSDGHGGHSRGCTRDAAHTEQGSCTDGADADELCDACGYDLHVHIHNGYAYDRNGHWKVCACGDALAPEKHDWYIYKEDAKGHYWRCDCGNNGWRDDHFDNNNTHMCDDCGYDVHHIFYSATCTAPAACSCGVITGNIDRSNHTGGTEIRNAKEATRTEKGYTGDTHCKGCGSIIALGEEIPATGFVAVKIADDADVLEVTFTTAEGVTLPEDAVLVVEPHTPSEDDLDFLLGLDADTEYLDADDVDISIVGGGVYTAPDGTEYSIYEIIRINGEEYLITNYMGTGDVLGLMRLSDGATCNYMAAVNMLDFNGSMNSTVQDYAYDKVNIGGVTYDVQLSYANAQGTFEVILYYNGSPAAKLRNYEDCYFLEGFDPETLKAQQNVSDLGTVTPGENPIDGLVSGKTYNVSVVGSLDISLPGYDDALLDSIKVETEAEKAAKEEVERLKADMEAKKAALDQLDANDPKHMEAWAAWYEAETAYKEALAAFSVSGLDTAQMLLVTMGFDADSHGYSPGAFAEPDASTQFKIGTVTQKFQIPDELVGRADVTFVAVHDPNPYAKALAEAAETRFISSHNEMEYIKLKTLYDSWAEANAAGRTDRVSGIDDEAVLLDDAENASDALAVQYTAKQGIVTGYEYSPMQQRSMYDWGQTHLSEDGKTLTATYEVDSFSPFIVYAFVEADEPEIKEFVTQPDGTLARVVNGQPATTHTVASGENLTVIARKYGCTVDEIVALNSDLIKNPSVISVGWVLTIPQR